MTDELDLLSRLGADVAPMSAQTRARTREQLLARAGQATADPAEQAPNPLGLPAGGPRRRWRSRRFGLRLGVAGVAAAGVAVATGVMLPGTAAAAYTLEEQANGAVQVRINEFREAKDLQADLRAAGIAAVVDYLPIGQSCQQPRGKPVRLDPTVPLGKVGTSVRQDKRGATFEVSGLDLRPGQTLVLEANYNKDDPSQGNGLGMTVVEGPVVPCRPVSAPFPRPGQSGAGTPGEQHSDIRQEPAGAGPHNETGGGATSGGATSGGSAGSAGAGVRSGGSVSAR